MSIANGRRGLGTNAAGIALLGVLVAGCFNCGPYSQAIRLKGEALHAADSRPDTVMLDLRHVDDAGHRFSAQVLFADGAPERNLDEHVTSVVLRTVSGELLIRYQEESGQAQFPLGFKQITESEYDNLVALGNAGQLVVEYTTDLPDMMSIVVPVTLHSDTGWHRDCPIGIV